MRHHTVTATFSASADEVFAYVANVDNLPEWATEFARELKLVDGCHKVVNGLGEFFFEIRADRKSGVIDMLAGPREDALQLFPTASLWNRSSGYRPPSARAGPRLDRHKSINRQALLTSPGRSAR
jgi:hypothetical protein